MADHGFKIVLGNNNIRRVGIRYEKFNSEKKLLKIFAKGSGGFTFTDGGAGFDISVNVHNLGYIPIFQLFCQTYDVNTNSEFLDYSIVPILNRFVGGAVFDRYYTTMSATELRFAGGSFGGDSAVHTLNYYYIIYYDPQV